MGRCCKCNCCVQKRRQACQQQQRCTVQITTKCKKPAPPPQPTPQPSICSLYDDYSDSEESASTSYVSTCTTVSSTTSETEEEEDIPMVHVDASLFRSPLHVGQVFKHFIMDGDGAVVKWVRCRHGSRCAFNCIDAYIRSVAKTVDIIDAFQRCVNTCGWRLTVLLPRQIRTPAVHGHMHGRIAILEKFIPDLVKVNSNTGWCKQARSIPGKLCQALSHFSYAFTKGELVVCNFHVHIDHDEKVIHIVAPKVVTREGGVYGCWDVGIKGVRNFFKWHCCSAFCNGYCKPKHISEPYFSPVEHSLLMMG